MMGRLILKHKKVIFLITLLFTLISIIGLFFIKIDSDLLKYMRPNTPEVREMVYIADKFKSGDVVMVIIESDSIFSPEFLNRLKNFTIEMKDTEGITGVMGIFTVINIEKTDYGIEMGSYMEMPIPEDRDSLLSLRKKLLSDSSFCTFISQDGRFTSVIGRVVNGYDKSRAAGNVKTLAEKFFKDETLYFAGVPFQMFFMERMIKKDLYLLIPVSLIVLFFILLLSFRSIKGIIIPIFTVSLGTIWIMGLHGIAGVPITVVSNTIPVIILAIGSAYSIHILHKFYEEREKGKGIQRSLEDTLSNVGYAVLMAGITTAVGFFTLIFSEIKLLRNFAIFVSIGVLFVIFISLGPGAFMVSLGKKKRTRKELKLKYIPSYIMKGRLYIFIVAAILTLFALVGMFRIRRNVDLIKYFDRDNPVRKGEEIVNKYLGGSIPVYVLIRTEDVRIPEILWVAWGIEERLRKFKELKPPFSFIDYIIKMENVMEGIPAIPLTRDDMDNLWFLMTGQEIAEYLVDMDARELLIQASAASLNTEVNAKTGEEISRMLDTIPQEFYLVPTPKVLEPAVNRCVDFISLYSPVRKEGLNRIILSLMRDTVEMEFERLKNFILNNDFGYRVNPSRLTVFIETLKGEMLDRTTFEEYFKTNFPPQGDSLDYQDFLHFSYNIYLKNYARVKHDYIWERIKDSLKMQPSDTMKIKSALYMLFTEYQALPFEKEGYVKKVKFMPSVTGFPIVYKMIDRNLLKTQFISLIVALIVVIILVMFEFRSIKFGAVSIVPIIFTLIMIFGLMGWLKIPLDAITIIIGAVSVGVGIDYTIHILSRYKRTGNMITVLTHTGMAVLINAISVGLGLAVLSLSSLIPLRRVGQLLFLTMMVSSISALTLLPAILHSKKN